MYLTKKTLFFIAIIVLMIGCTKSVEDTEEFNKPALYWYKKIAKSIGQGDMDKADSFYISLKSEHVRSPLMPTAIMILAHAHIEDESYLLANYYLDEYNKRYSANDNRDYIDFMKIKAAFLGISNAYKDQKLMLDSIKKSQTFIYRYPGSMYTPLVNTILTKLHMSQYLLNENIAALYDRTAKPKAAKMYRAKNDGSLLKITDIKAPKKGFVGKIFD
jgi:outer membrane protein assembly factor BamD